VAQRTQVRKTTNKKTAREVRLARLERAASALRALAMRVGVRPTPMDCGDSVSICARTGVDGDSVELWLLYPEGARALGEALIEAAGRCRPNIRQPSIASKDYLGDGGEK